MTPIKELAAEALDKWFDEEAECENLEDDFTRIVTEALRKQRDEIRNLMDNHMSHPSNKPCPEALAIGHIWVCWDYIYEFELLQQEKDDDNDS